MSTLVIDVARVTKDVELFVGSDYVMVVAKSFFSGENWDRVIRQIEPWCVSTMIDFGENFYYDPDTDEQVYIFLLKQGYFGPLDVFI